MPFLNLRTTYKIEFSSNRVPTREAINWCFDNATSDWSLEKVHQTIEDNDGDGWASFVVNFSSDRDAVLFKTFWNDR